MVRPSRCDGQGFLIVEVGMQFDLRNGPTFVFRELLGQGQFGQVFRVEARNPRTGESSECAMKISRNYPQYRSQADHEAQILQFLWNSATPAERVLFSRILYRFNLLGHTVIVTELLSVDLYKLVSDVRQSVGLPIALLQSYARDLFQALLFFERLGIVHGDLKLENIVVLPHNVEHVKVIDFGQARQIAQPQTDYIQSRYYRAPETVLCLAQRPPIDMWSIGCILCELFLGVPLFPGQSEHQLLGWHVRFLGPIPAEIASASPRRALFFLASGELKSEAQFSADTGSPPPPRYDYHQWFTVGQLILEADFEPEATEEEIQGECAMRKLLVDLIEKIFVYRPESRITPRQALVHPFLTAVFEDEEEDAQE
jgi:dual specificity protein kinase YAK1